jgi:hypothetical protein
MRAVLVLACSGWLGCGDGGNSGRSAGCDTRVLNGVCTDYAVPESSLASFKSTCANDGGTWKDRGCDHGVGGCRQMFGTSTFTYTAWYYPPLTSADVMAQCGASYVAP